MTARRGGIILGRGRATRQSRPHRRSSPRRGAEVVAPSPVRVRARPDGLVDEQVAGRDDRQRARRRRAGSALAPCSHERAGRTGLPAFADRRIGGVAALAVAGDERCAAEGGDREGADEEDGGCEPHDELLPRRPDAVEPQRRVTAPGAPLERLCSTRTSF